MSNFDEAATFLLDTVDKLSKAGIPYMISGSYAVLLYGQPRTTQDIDIVIAPAQDQIEAFVSAIGADQYVSAEAARDAVARQTLFNVIDTTTGWKIDLIVRKPRAFSIEEFNRRRQVKFLGHVVYVVSPEDSILSKLEWSQKGGSDRQLRDAEAVAAIQWDALDQKYLYHWAAELRVVPELDLVLDRAKLLVGQQRSANSRGNSGENS